MNNGMDIFVFKIRVKRVFKIRVKRVLYGSSILIIIMLYEYLPFLIRIQIMAWETHTVSGFKNINQNTILFCYKKVTND